MTMEQLDLHGERAALRGNPSFVWRAGQDRRLEMIIRWGMPAGQRTGAVLVDGCGVGMYIKALRPYAEMVCGIDIEAEHLSLARQNAPDAGLSLAMCEALPHPDNAFDLVLSHEVLEHVSDDRLAAAEMVRVLKPGGRAVIFVPNRLYPFETHGVYWQGRYHFGNIPLVNYLPDSLRPVGAARARLHASRSALALCRPAGFDCAPQPDLPRLRQPQRPAPAIGPLDPAGDLCAGEFAVGDAGAEPSVGDREARELKLGLPS